MPRSINRGRIVLLCCVLTLAAVSSGCRRGPAWDLAPVSGTVRRAGQPLADMRVVFWADVEAGTQGPRASGITDADGHYELCTDAGEKGVAVGRYRVCLADISVLSSDLPRSPGKGRDKAGTEPAKGAASKSRVPSTHGRPAQTPLRVEVHPGPQTLDFDLP